MPASRSGFSTSGRSLNSRTSGRALPLAVLAVGFEAEVLAGSSAGADPRAHAKNFGPNALRSAPGFATAQDIKVFRRPNARTWMPSLDYASRAPASHEWRTWSE